MTVHLVGAGPGDADLLTVRAAGLLADAEAVVYDRLIGDDIIGLASPRAEHYPVGKEPGRPGPTQDEINDLLVGLGHRLRTVVRVKGGDPYIFGRGIEEADRLRQAGIDVDVVPGISSSLAAPMAAGISVTERGTSSGVCIVTAQQGRYSAPIDWSAVARTGLTIVVLMGARRAGDVSKRLIAGGLSEHTPTAVVTNASRPDQTIWAGPLRELGRQPVPSPSVLIIGDVARFRAAGRRERSLVSAAVAM